MRILMIVEITLCLFWRNSITNYLPLHKKNITEIQISSFFKGFELYDEPLQLFILTV